MNNPAILQDSRCTTHYARFYAECIFGKALSVVLLHKPYGCVLWSCQNRYKVVTSLSHISDGHVLGCVCTCVSCASQDMFGAAESKSTDSAETPPRDHREPEHARMLTASMPPFQV